MNRAELQQSFNINGPVILPVIHVLNLNQTKKNVEVALQSGCKGVFLINHDFSYQKFLPIICKIRNLFPKFWLGVNFLGITGKDAFPVLGDLKTKGFKINAYWADDARIKEKSSINNQPEAEQILSIKAASGWDGLYFGGTAFKKQRPVHHDDWSCAAKLACRFMDIVTTSGEATGYAPDLKKMIVFRKACEKTALALASGITIENAEIFAGLADIFMVATGINFKGDFYNIDPKNLNELIQKLS